VRQRVRDIERRGAALRDNQPLMQGEENPGDLIADLGNQVEQLRSQVDSLAQDKDELEARNTALGNNERQLGLKVEQLISQVGSLTQDRAGQVEQLQTQVASLQTQISLERTMDDTNSMCHKILIRAVMNGDEKLLPHIIHISPRGIVDAVSVDGWTALHYAARWGHTEVARKLICFRASPNAQDSVGCTPLHHAVRCSRGTATGVVPDLALIKALIDGGADVNLMDNHQLTALDYDKQISGSQYGRICMMDCLDRASRRN
jgi:hypothetical protein